MNNFNIGDKVKIESIDNSGYLFGKVTGFQFEKVLILLDEYPSASYSFDKNKIEKITDDYDKTGKNPAAKTQDIKKQASY